MMHSIQDYSAEPDVERPGGEPVLWVRGLSIETTGPDPTRVVEDLELSISRGETFALVGESGAGKSIAALSLMGLIPKSFAEITAGSVQLAGQELTGMSQKQLRSVRGNDMAMIFQDPLSSLNPVMTIGRQITEAITAHDDVSGVEARKRGVDLLKLVHIPAAEARFDDYPHRLSGGMRQRVMIAMALACSPKLLIADEPTTALDVTIQTQILNLLSELQAETGIAVLLVTHDLGVVRQSATKMAVMYAGRIVETGSVEKVLANPGHPYTAGLLSARPYGSFVEGQHRLKEIPGTVPPLRSRPSGCGFRTRCAYATDQCSSERPRLDEVEGGHALACHFPLGKV